MANILVLETDPVATALLADRLHVSGHSAILIDDPQKTVSAAAGQADVVILDMDLGAVAGLEVIRRLRARFETRSLPIVALSVSDDRDDRLAALKAGADEYLTRPVDAEELLLRIDRLLGRRGEAPPVLQGDLEDHPAWELVQYVHNTGKDGELKVHVRGGSGRVVFRGGRVTAASWKKLSGRDALLTVLDTPKGRFRLTTEPAAEPEAGGDGFAIEEVLMQSAWLADELVKRRRHLPATGASLHLAARELPAIDSELRDLPIETVFRRLAERPGLRLYDLIDQLNEAPSKVRLAVAWLAEHGVLAPVAAEILSTEEISSSMVLDLAILDLLAATRRIGVEDPLVGYLVLAEPSVLPQLVGLLEGEAGLRGVAELAALRDQLRAGGGGKTDFAIDGGTLSLHVRILSAASRSRIAALVPACAGVMIWLDRCKELGLVRSVVDGFEATDGAATGIVVAGRPATHEALARLTARTRRWRVSRQVPHSLIGVLRLLRPRRG